ncbi:PAS domain-containing sensor histidine kinase [Granulosicoccus sp. 3-233]|uniref:PAS domain-containing sensor histidine kinase n=1 Tax=Granulosicoccus sp. 3-233 TaxID=3417969 RepID=UPI003D342F04
MHQFYQYEFAFEVSPVPMLLVSEAGDILLTNQLMSELFEYEHGELIGKKVEILVPEAIRQHHPGLRGAYFTYPVKRNMGQGRDLNGVTRTGKTIPLELGLDTVMVDGSLCALVVALDIRQRKLHEQRMNLAMDAAASAMIMVNDEGRIVFVNKAALQLFGHDESQLLNSPIEQLVPDDIKQAHPVYRNGFMRASKPRPMAKERTLFALHRTGRKIPVEIALTPVDTHDGKMVVSTIIDLSERVDAENAMAEKHRELASLNEELMQFAYSASHDLKAPLTTITGLLELCLEDLEEGDLDSVREVLNRTLMIGMRSAEKVEGVLEIARVERSPISAEQIDLESMVNDIWEDLTGNRDVSARLVVSINHDNTVFLEKNTLHVILENLLSNAVRYVDQDKSQHIIEVSSQATDESIIIDVLDNGIGIPTDSQSKVFELFSRIDERSDHGLGLALVKKHVDRLQGSISVDSTPGVKTTFSVSLPLQDVRRAS